jgi:hypothetical protein
VDGLGPTRALGHRAAQRRQPVARGRRLGPREVGRALPSQPAVRAAPEPGTPTLRPGAMGRAPGRPRRARHRRRRRARADRAPQGHGAAAPVLPGDVRPVPEPRPARRAARRRSAARRTRHRGRAGARTLLRRRGRPGPGGRVLVHGRGGRPALHDGRHGAAAAGPPPARRRPFAPRRAPRAPARRARGAAGRRRHRPRRRGPRRLPRRGPRPRVGCAVDPLEPGLRLRGRGGGAEEAARRLAARARGAARGHGH